MRDFKEITAQVQAWIDQMQAAGKHVDIDTINQHLEEMMTVQNNAPADYFNGFTPQQMHKMMYSPLEDGCPVQLRTLADNQIAEIPIMRQVLCLMTILASGELKLTAQGYIPPKIVNELYQIGTHSWYTDWFKQKNEPKVEEVQVLRVVLKECGLIKTRIGRMSLTAKGKSLLSKHNELLHTVMLFLLRDYNTGWLDAYDDMEVGNVGRLYSLWLLHHFGDQWRNTDFYADEYFRAFPAMINDDIYGYRIFNRLFRCIGLCDINERAEDRGHEFGQKVIKTDFLDKVFVFQEPQQ